MKRVIACMAMGMMSLGVARADTGQVGGFIPLSLDALAVKIAPLIASGSFAGAEIGKATVNGASLNVILSQITADMAAVTADSQTAQNQAKLAQANAEAAQKAADAAIPAAQIGAASGVAGLNAQLQVTAPLLTQQQTLSYAGYSLGQVLGAFSDAWTPPWMARYGGMASGRPMAEQVNGIPDGANDSGAVLAVGATDASFSSIRPGIGPDGLTNGVGAIASYGSLDGAVISNQADTPVPLVRAGADIKDWQGNTHAVTFGCSGHAARICFSPVLPAAWVSLLHPGEHVLTNVIGPGPNPVGGNAFQMPNVLASQISSVDPLGAYVDTVGWAVPGSNISNGFIPMASSYAGDGSHPAVTAGTLDQKWSQYSHPAVFFGAVTSMFSNYGYCKFDHKNAHGGPPNALPADSMMHVCTAMQFDVFNNDADYTNSFGGWGIAYQGPGKPTSDSQMVWLSGAVPTYNRYRFVDQGTRLFDTTAGFNVDYPLPLPTDGTTGAASARFMQGNESQISGIALKLQSWSQVDAKLPASPSLGDLVNAASFHLGVNWASGPNTHTVDGNNVGQIVFNTGCDGAANSVALAGGGSGPYAPNIGVCVEPSGSAAMPNGLNILKGTSLSFHPTDTSSGWAFVEPTGGTSLAFRRTLDGQGADVTMGALTATKLTVGDIAGAVFDTGTGETLDWSRQDRAPARLVSAATFSTDTLVTGGQGTIHAWNLVPGRAATTIVNVNPGVLGGFQFYDTPSGSVATAGTLLFDLSAGSGAIFGVSAHAPGYGTSRTAERLADVKAASNHYISEQVWCADCLNDGQAAGAGTGRWIFLDTGYVWRSQDGKAASN